MRHSNFDLYSNLYLCSGNLIAYNGQRCENIIEFYKTMAMTILLVGDNNVEANRYQKSN